VSSTTHQSEIYSKIAIVIIDMPQHAEAEYLRILETHWQKHPIKPEVGKEIIWP
jgi:hypothetical protein